MVKIRLFLLAFLTIVNYSLSAQVAINTDGTLPDNSAMLDVNSDTAGVLIPRMMQTQREAINGPEEGLLVYQSDAQAGFYYYDGANWIGITGAGGGAISSSSCIDFDGNAYPTFAIGNQVWMAENLRVIHYRNGDAIPIVKNSATWETLTSGAYCWYENDKTAYEKYGTLYNWYTVDDSRGLCPDGWHVPTNAEWTTLTTYLGGASIAGGKMKSNSDLWESPNLDASNTSNFSGLPGGDRSSDGTFLELGYYGLWWSSTESSSSSAWRRALLYNNSSVTAAPPDKQFGYSVRCLRD